MKIMNWQVVVLVEKEPSNTISNLPNVSRCLGQFKFRFGDGSIKDPRNIDNATYICTAVSQKEDPHRCE
jgi:hypothetical protein